MGKGDLSRVAVALDTDDRDEFREWCRFFGPRVGLLKVGLEAFLRWGPSAVEDARVSGRGVFLDLKLHDIPNTVAGAVRSASQLGIDFLTIHSGGGRAMLEAAVEASDRNLQLLAVTVLTHLDRQALSDLGWDLEPADRVSALAELAVSSGCSGVIASPLEVQRVRSEVPSNFLIVTPGIRPKGAEQGDQRRTATPARAFQFGADYLVIGRPLTRATDRESALKALEQELAAEAIT